MDGIQTYRGYAAPPSPLRGAPASLTINPAAIKTVSNYLRALRRRAWVVLAVAVPLAIVGAIYVLRLPPAPSEPGTPDARRAHLGCQRD